MSAYLGLPMETVANMFMPIPSSAVSRQPPAPSDKARRGGTSCNKACEIAQVIYDVALFLISAQLGSAVLTSSLRETMLKQNRITLLQRRTREREREAKHNKRIHSNFCYEIRVLALTNLDRRLLKRRNFRVGIRSLRAI